MPLTKQFVVTGPRTTDYINYSGHGSVIQTNDGAELMLFMGQEIDTERHIIRCDLIVNGKENQPVATTQFSVQGHYNYNSQRPEFQPLAKDDQDNIYFAVFQVDQTSTTQRFMQIYKIACPPQGWMRWSDMTLSYDTETGINTNDQGVVSGNSEVINVAASTSVNLTTSPYTITAGISGSTSPSPVDLQISRISVSPDIGSTRRYISDVMWIKGHYLLVWMYTENTSDNQEYWTAHTFQLKTQVNIAQDRYYQQGEYIGYSEIQRYKGDSSASMLDDNTQFGFGEPVGAYVWGNNSQSLSTAGYQGHFVNLWRFNYLTLRVETFASSAVGNSSNQSWQGFGERFSRGFGHVVGYLGRYSGNYYFSVLGPDSDTSIDSNIRAYIMFTNGSNFASPAATPTVHTSWTDSAAGWHTRWRGSNNSAASPSGDGGRRYNRQLQVFQEEKKMRLWQHGADNWDGTTSSTGIFYFDIDYNFGETTSLTFPAVATKFTDMNYCWSRQGVVQGVAKYPTKAATNFYWSMYNGTVRDRLGFENLQDRNSASSNWGWNQSYNRIGVWTLSSDGITRNAPTAGSATALAPIDSTLGQPGGVALKFKPLIRTTTTGAGSTYWGYATNIRGFRLSATTGGTTTYWDGTTLGATQTTIPFYSTGMTAKDNEIVTVNIPGSALTPGATYDFKVAFVTEDGTVSAYSSTFKSITFTAAPAAPTTPTAKRICRVNTQGIEDAHVANIDNRVLINKINISNPTGQSGKFAVKINNFSVMAPVYVPNGSSLQVDTSILADAGDKVFVTGSVGGTVYITGTEGV